jgi:hypothetical protein
MRKHRNKLLGAAVAVCALAGAGAGIAQSATSKSKAQTRHAKQASSRGPFGGPMDGDHGGGVHSVSVVPNKAGTAFVTVTSDRGTIKSVDAGAGTITITEGTESLTYGTPTLTIPSGATVVLDGKSSSLASLAAGDHVTVDSSSEGTTVFAADSSFHPEGPGFGPQGHGGPPPGAWGAGTPPNN